MKDIKLPKTLNQVRKELAKVYYLARVAQNRTQLETLRLMKDALRGQVQAAAIAIDAYPERTIRGRVASVQPGSGTAFSLLPAENATGNFVKIVQRVPVKLVIDRPPADIALGPGMSVVPTVRVDPLPSLAERLWSLR